VRAKGSASGGDDVGTPDMEEMVVGDEPGSLPKTVADDDNTPLGYVRLGRDPNVNVIRLDVDLIVNGTVSSSATYSSSLFSSLTRLLDPMVLVQETARDIPDDAALNQVSSPQETERLAREKSIKKNRRRKFVESLNGDSLEIC
jgi:hypothetical protein